MKKEDIKIAYEIVQKIEDLTDEIDLLKLTVERAIPDSYRYLAIGPTYELNKKYFITPETSKALLKTMLYHKKQELIKLEEKLRKI